MIKRDYKFPLFSAALQAFFVCFFLTSCVTKQPTTPRAEDLDTLLERVKKEETQTTVELKYKVQNGLKLSSLVKQDIVKFNEIVSSPHGKDMKEAAWKSLAVKYPVLTTGLRIGNIKGMFYRLNKKIGIKTGKIWREPITGMEFVWIPYGCFEMGSKPDEKGRNDDEGPVHFVCLDGFWMGRFEVTNAQYSKFQWRRKYRYDDENDPRHDYHRDNHPVYDIHWEDAKAFAEWLTRQNNSWYKFRLPTEAEWEYACRAGTKTARFWGNNSRSACKYANVQDRTAYRWQRMAWSLKCEDGYIVTAPVGNYKPNAWGLYDMLGNVDEWCLDIYDRYAYDKHQLFNPAVEYGGSSHVDRGGDYGIFQEAVRSACRHQGDRDSVYGFRLVRRP